MKVQTGSVQKCKEEYKLDEQENEVIPSELQNSGYSTRKRGPPAWILPFVLHSGCGNFG